MLAILNEIVNLLVGALVSIGTAIGQGLSSIVSAIFITTTGDTMSLSVFGGVVIIFAAIGLGTGLTRWCLNFVTSLGQRNN